MTEEQKDNEHYIFDESKENSHGCKLCGMWYKTKYYFEKKHLKSTLHIANDTNEVTDDSFDLIKSQYKMINELFENLKQQNDILLVHIENIEKKICDNEVSIINQSKILEKQELLLTKLQKQNNKDSEKPENKVTYNSKLTDNLSKTIDLPSNKIQSNRINNNMYRNINGLYARNQQYYYCKI